MRVRSLGLHTDLALAEWRGVVRDRHDHLVVTHPTAPSFRGGNLLVFERPPEPGDLERWCALFDGAIGTPPAYPYRTLAWDGLDGEEGRLEPFLAAGFERTLGVVLAASRLLPPERPRTDLRLEPLSGDAGWDAAVRVQAADTTPERRPRYTRLVSDVMRLNRRAVEAGHGMWWGAFDGDAMVGTLGIYRVDELARFQAVVTHPDERNRGVASTLLHHAAEAARAAWGSELLLLEADAEGAALELYQRLGLTPLERRVSITQDRSSPGDRAHRGDRRLTSFAYPVDTVTRTPTSTDDAGCRIAFDGTVNTRDLGGWPLQGGGATRVGRIWRSDAFTRATQRDRDRLAERGVRTFLDLRTVTEVEAAPHPLAVDERFEIVHVDVFGPVVAGIMRGEVTGDPFDLRTHYIASFRLARDAYAQVFAGMTKALETHEGPVVVYCTAGKDRTGLVAALLLRAVGVDDATIAAEYALTHDRIESIRPQLLADGARVGLPNEASALLLDAHAQTMADTLSALDDDLVVLASAAARHLR